VILWTLSVVIKGRNTRMVTFPVWGECYKYYLDHYQDYLWRCDPVKVGTCYFNPTPFLTTADKFLEDTQFSEGWTNYDFYQAGYARAKNERQES